MRTRTERFPGLRAAAVLYRFRESLFVLPVMMVLGGMLLAVLTAAVDDALGAGTAVPFTLSMDSGVATWLLSTIAGATITTAGVIFSLTIVSLQLASSQLSPRVMRWFIRDRLSQVVIGLLVATFVYCVLTLPQITAESPAPPVAVTVAVVLTVVTVITIIAHLDHLAHRLEVGNVVRAIAAEGLSVIDAVAAAAAAEQPAPDAQMAPPEDALRIESPSNGWVSQIDTGRLLAAAPKGMTVRLETRVGAYIHRGQPLAAVWPPPAHPERLRRRVTREIVVSGSRTMQQDIDFAFRQLVDIGLRALSSAINDPTTAVEATLRVGSLLRRLLVVPPALPAVAGSGGRTLLRPWDLDSREYIAHGFDQLRHVAPGQPLVAATILRVVRMLIAHVEQSGRPEHVPALREQIDLLLGSLDTTPGLHPHDLRRLRAISANITDPADHSYRRLSP